MKTKESVIQAGEKQDQSSEKVMKTPNAQPPLEFKDIKITRPGKTAAGLKGITVALGHIYE